MIIDNDALSKQQLLIMLPYQNQYCSIFFLFLFFVIFSCFANANHTHNPKHNFSVTIGDGGSRLYSKLDKPSSNHWYCAKKSDWSLFWVEFDIFVVPWPRNCFLENIELVFNHTDNTTYNQPGSLSLKR